MFRPHWEKCAQYVEGGTDRWNELSQNRSSDELVDVLLAEMTGQDIAIIQAGVSTGAEYFQGQVKIIRTRRMILVVYLTLLQISMVVMIYNNWVMSYGLPVVILAQWWWLMMTMTVVWFNVITTLILVIGMVWTMVKWMWETKFYSAGWALGFSRLIYI